MNTTPKGLRLLTALVLLILLLSVCCSAFAYDTIHFGDEGPAVADLQRALKSKGYYKGKIDSTFGQKTRSAVYRYQKAIGLRADGKPGDKTLTALYEGKNTANTVNSDRAATASAKNPKTLYYGCTGTRVKSLQRMLHKLGYFKGTTDGTYGDATYQAVKHFQWAKGLSGDGKAGTKTLAALKEALAN